MRRVPVPCILCKTEHTLADNRICRACMVFYERGKLAAHNELTGEKERYFFPSYVLHIHQPNSLRDDFYFAHLISGLTGEPIERTYEYKKPPYFTDDGKLHRLILVPCDRDDIPEVKRVLGLSAFGDASISCVMLTEGQAAIIQKAIHLITHEIKKRNQEGLREGANFTQRMAKGEISIDDINKWTANLDKP